MKDRKTAKENVEAGKAINAAAKSEIDIINVLQSIDFLHSKLPKAYLQHSTDPNDPRGDLEVAKDRAIHTLKRATVTPRVKLAPIDDQLMEIAQRFKNAVEQGDVYAAYAGKAALSVGVDKIRTRVHAVPDNNADNFIKKSSDYLREWCVLIDMSAAYDAEERGVNEQTAHVVGQEEDFAEQKKEIRQKLEENGDFARAFNHILEHSGSSDRMKWTELQRKAFEELIQRRVSKVNLSLSHSVLSQKKAMHLFNGGKIEQLQTKLAALPDTTDENLLNFFNQAMEDFANEMALMDTQIDESLKALSDFEGRLKQLELGKGNQALLETASEEAENFMKEWKQEQKETLTANEPGGSLLEQFGVVTENEMEARLEELKAQREQEEARQQEVQRQNERQVLFNG